MKFLSFASKAMRVINSKKNKDSSENVDSSEEGVSNGKFKFPIWLLGGGFGFLGFAFLCSFITIIAALIILGIIEVDNSVAKNNCVNLPAIDTVCESITVDGFGTMSVDEYVAGVINGEIASYIDPNYNAYKALAIAARSYGLVRSSKDGNGNCSVSDGASFQNYEPNPSQAMIDVAEETSGMVLVKNNSLFDSEYDALCIESEDNQNYYLCQGGESEEHLTLPISWVNENVLPIQGSDYVDYIRQYVHGKGMSQNGAWYLALDKGWDYTQILEYFYGDEGITLASINGATSSCSTSFNGNFEPLETYNLAHNGLNVLDRTLTTEEIENLDNYINSEVDKAGYGTGAGVAAAGQALTYWLEQQGYYLQYYWGGGQGLGEGNNTFIGTNPKWGSTEFGDDTEPGNSHYRPYYGMDCSGFTSWAVRTACKPTFGSVQAHIWYYSLSDIEYISLDEAKPGDMLSSDSHVQLVVKNNGDGSVIVAEETGGGTSGLVFTLVDSSSGYYVVDMSDWYANNCASSR